MGVSARPAAPSTTPRPHRVNPGSTPRTRMPSPNARSKIRGERSEAAGPTRLDRIRVALPGLNDLRRPGRPTQIKPTGRAADVAPPGSRGVLVVRRRGPRTGVDG